MKLRLHITDDGARVAYREAGAGLVASASRVLRCTPRCSATASGSPWSSTSATASGVVLPDLPLHGDSEDRPRHPYTLDWLAEVLAAFCAETAGPRPLVGGHGLGAEILLRAVELGAAGAGQARAGAQPPAPPDAARAVGHRAARRRARGRVPGLDRVLSHGARLAFRPDLGVKLSARAAPAARDLVRHAFADVGGNANLARSWARFARRYDRGARLEVLDLLPRLPLPRAAAVGRRGPLHPLESAEEALDLLPDGMLRVLPGTGFLIAYDDPVGVGARAGGVLRLSAQ